MKNVKSGLTLVTVILLTVVVNLMIFVGIPFLSAATAKKNTETFDSFVSFKMDKPVIKERKKIEKEPEKENKPKKMPKLNMKHEAHKVTRPKLNVNMPKMNFALNSKLSEGMAVAMPADGGVTAAMAGMKLEFEIGEVDTPPRVVYKTNPIYPFAAKRRHITGKVVLRFLVDKSGVVKKMKVVKSEPKGVFDKAVLDSLSRWRFKPGIYENKPVNTWVVAPFDFRM